MKFSLTEFIKTLVVNAAVSPIPQRNAGQFPIPEYLLSPANFNAIARNGVLDTVNGAVLRSPAIAHRQGRKIQVVVNPKYSAAERANAAVGYTNTKQWCPTNGQTQDEKVTMEFAMRYEYVSKVYSFDTCYDQQTTGRYPTGVDAYDRNNPAFVAHFNQKLSEFEDEVLIMMHNLFTKGYAHDGKPYIGRVPCAKDNSCVEIPILTADGSKINMKGFVMLQHLKNDLGMNENENLNVFGYKFYNATLLSSWTRGVDNNGIFRGDGFGVNFKKDNTIAKNENDCDIAIVGGSFAPIVMPYSNVVGVISEKEARTYSLTPTLGLQVYVTWNYSTCRENPSPSFEFSVIYDILSENTCGATTDPRLRGVTGAFNINAICADEDNCSPLTPCQTANAVAEPKPIVNDCNVTVLPACADKCNVFATHTFVSATKYCVKLSQFTTVASVTVNGDTTLLSTAYDTTDPVQMLLLGAELQGILGSNTVVIESGPGTLCVVKKGTPYVQFFLTSADGGDFDTDDAVSVSLFTLTTTGSAPTAYTLDITVGGNNFPAAAPDAIATGVVTGAYGTYQNLYITVPSGTVNGGDAINISLSASDCSANYSGTVGTLVP